METTTEKYYRVNLIRSERACQREGYEPRKLEKHVIDCPDYASAKSAYDNLTTGAEVGKEILFIAEDKNGIQDSQLVEAIY